MYQNEKAINACYINDLLEFTKHMQYFEYLKGQLQNDLNTKDLGEPWQFMGMKFHWKHEDIFILRQSNLVAKSLKSSGMSMAKPTKIPMKPAVDISVRVEKLNDDYAAAYRGVVGGLSYITVRKRFDISVAASALGSHVIDPT